jgi:hypothetical protein
VSWRISSPRTRLSIAAGLVLLAGLAVSAWIYLTVPAGPGDAVGYAGEGGSAYPIAPEDSKTYLRNLQMYGGTANVLADELRRWFLGLWQGRSLACTVAGLAVAVSLVLLAVAWNLDDDGEPDDQAEDGRQDR